MIQKKLLCVTEFQFLHVPVTNRYRNAMKQAARREHALRSCIFGVKNASNADVNLEQTMQNAVFHIPSVSAVQEKVIHHCDHLVLTYRIRHFLCPLVWNRLNSRTTPRYPQTGTQCCWCLQIIMQNNRNIHGTMQCDHNLVH
jgi:hypothetical protein